MSLSAVSHLPQVSVHTEEQEMFLQEVAPLGSEPEPGMSLPSVKVQLKCESPDLEAQQEQGKEERPILGGREDAANTGHWGFFVLHAVSDYQSQDSLQESDSSCVDLRQPRLSFSNSVFLFILIFS